MRVQNPSAKSLRQRAGHAGQSIVADTRPKIVAPRKGKGSYRRDQVKRNQVKRDKPGGRSK